MMQDDDIKDTSYLPHVSFFFPTISTVLKTVHLKITQRPFSGIVVQKNISSKSIFPCKLGDTMVPFSQALDTYSFC